MVKILMVSNDLALHGISNVIINYYKAIDNEKIIIDIAAGKPIEKNFINIKKNNGKIHVLPERKKKPISYYKELYLLMKQNKYDIVHVHGNSSTISIELFVAKIAGIKIRVAHSHNSTCNHLIMHKLLKPIFFKLYTNGFACSEIAGKWMFGNKEFDIINNGFEVENYRFSLDRRNDLRNRLNLKNSFVIGHVGCFNQQKNHTFMLDVFKEVLKNDPNSVMLLVGGGHTKESIKQKVKELNIENNVIFYGETTDVSSLLCCMDTFLFPSLFEGLGISLLEAQISGLPCILSDVVPIAAKLCNQYYELSLTNNSIQEWAECIVKNKINIENRDDFIDSHKDELSSYDISVLSKKLEEKYFRFINKERLK